MESLYDVQQLFKKFGIFIYVGARIYDIELMTTGSPSISIIFWNKITDR